MAITFDYPPLNLGYILRVPTLDLVEVGADGGSIARITVNRKLTPRNGPWIERAERKIGVGVGPSRQCAVPTRFEGSGGCRGVLTDEISPFFGDRVSRRLGVA